MTLQELHDRMSNSEFVRWRAFYEWEAWELEQRANLEKVNRR